MADTLPRLRLDLDFMPSPIKDRPGLLVRDPHQYSDATLIIPPALIECLQHFNGSSTSLDLRNTLVQLTGSLEVSEVLDHLHNTLSNAGFLDDEAFRKIRAERHQQFADAPVRIPTHAGSAYPDLAAELRSTLDGYFVESATEAAPADGMLGIAAPHVSPSGGWKSYAAAYRHLHQDLQDRVFVILGTSHYGAMNRFGLTRKPFETPYGVASTEVALVDYLARAAPDSIEMEDYCHSTEHSIEFQVVFLQHVFGPRIRTLPILCGSFAESIYRGGEPEDSDDVKAFIDALGQLAAREGDRLFWVLGVDMAHMGRRYGDPYAATAGQGYMEEVAQRDRARIERISAADPGGFWDLVRAGQDDLKWCGSAPFYTFMRALPDVHGRLLDYSQWNIDEQSVVSFGALGFAAGK